MTDVERRTTENGGSRPVPDPTVLTTALIDRAVAAVVTQFQGELAIRDERLTGIDRATELRLGGILEVPHLIDEKVRHLESIVLERFSSVQTQFKERDTRSERESRDNKVAVDAAFAAQKEAAAKQDEANQKAIDKSEKATNESIAKLGDVVKASVDAIADKIDDVKVRIGNLESQVNGLIQSRATVREVTTDQRAGNSLGVAFAGILIALLIGAIGIAIALAGVGLIVLILVIILIVR